MSSLYDYEVIFRWQNAVHRAYVAAPSGAVALERAESDLPDGWPAPDTDAVELRAVTCLGLAGA